MEYSHVHINIVIIHLIKSNTHFQYHIMMTPVYSSSNLYFQDEFVEEKLLYELKIRIK